MVSSEFFPSSRARKPGVREAAGTGPSLWQRPGLGDPATWGERASSHRDLMAFKGLRGREPAAPIGTTSPFGVAAG